MGSGLEARFERYGAAMAAALGHADRVAPATWYLQGLMLPGGRKSVETMAARVRPQAVRSAHQSMHHLVSTSDWSDTALLTTVAEQVLPALTRGGAQPCYWIIDDTGFPKKGTHSVGVVAAKAAKGSGSFSYSRAGHFAARLMALNSSPDLMPLGMLNQLTPPTYTRHLGQRSLPPADRSANLASRKRKAAWSTEKHPLYWENEPDPFLWTPFCGRLYPSTF